MSAVQPRLLPQPVACLGFGEAASAFVGGWRTVGSLTVQAYDLKTDSPDDAVRKAKAADYAALSVDGTASVAEALAGAGVVFSLVTADQALVAAEAAAQSIAPGTFYLDGNSCAPETKRRAAALIDAAGGRYVDCAVMAPVYPKRHHTPLSFSGPHAVAAAEALAPLDLKITQVAGPVGAASSIKMVRSIMMKGLEALMLECVLAGHKAGVADVVLESLEKTYPGFGWKDRAAYMMERVMTHGIRRAAEMREVAITVDNLGLNNAMTTAAVGWQEQVGALKLNAAALGEGDFSALADAILTHLPDTPPLAQPREQNR